MTQHTPTHTPQVIDINTLTHEELVEFIQEQVLASVRALDKNRWSDYALAHDMARAAWGELERRARAKITEQ